MGFIRDQFLDVIEWNETRDDVLFWTWDQREIKKNSRLCTNDFIRELVKAIQPYSDSIFLSWGKNHESDKDKFPIAFSISESQFSCNENYLSGLLEAIQPFSHIIHIDYGRN